MKINTYDVYQPIPCVQHERLEFAVPRRIPLRLRYLAEDGQVLKATVMPLDIQTRQSGEWLALRFDDDSLGECVWIVSSALQSAHSQATQLDRDSAPIAKPEIQRIPFRAHSRTTRRLSRGS